MDPNNSNPPTTCTGKKTGCSLLGVLSGVACLVLGFFIGAIVVGVSLLQSPKHYNQLVSTIQKFPGCESFVDHDDECSSCLHGCAYTHRGMHKHGKEIGERRGEHPQGPQHPPHVHPHLPMGPGPVVPPHAPVPPVAPQTPTQEPIVAPIAIPSLTTEPTTQEAPLAPKADAAPVPIVVPTLSEQPAQTAPEAPKAQ